MVVKRDELRFVRALRAAGRMSVPPLTAHELARLEREILARAGLRPAASPGRWLPGPAWLAPAGVVAAAACLVWLVLAQHSRSGSTGPSPIVAAGVEPGTPPVATGPDLLRKLRSLPLPSELPEPEVRPVVIADFEGVGDLARLVISGSARYALTSGAPGGGHAFSPGQAGSPEAPLEIEVPVPARARTGAAGISIWVRAAGGPVEASAVAGYGDGGSQELGAPRRVEPLAWSRAVFHLPPGAAAGPAWVRFRFVGQGRVELDRVEVWTTPPGAKP